MKQSREFVSFRMGKVRSKGSAIETILFEAAKQLPYRRRYHVKTLPGTPDLVFPEAKVCVFVDSEFWHGFHWSRTKQTVKTNSHYWIAKIAANMARDRRVNRELRAAGWSVLRFWGNEIRQEPDNCIARIIQIVNSRAMEGDP